MSGVETVRATEIAGVVEVIRRKRGDDRGYLERLFDAKDMADAGWPGPIAQVNRTHTRHAGTVRGMHYQTGDASEAKLVSCLSGRVFDVAVDLRDGSPTFGRWVAVELSPDAGNALLIPQGCAHGVQALDDDSTLVYVHSHAYAPEAEAGVNATDPALGIDWPLPLEPRSPRDVSLPPLAAATLPGVRSLSDGTPR